MTSQKSNEALATFTRYIGGLLWSGLVTFVLGIILAFGMGGFGFFVIYIGAILIALSVFGSFLRQTARAIIQGLNGNTAEITESKVERLGPEYKGLASTLTYHELLDWEKAGKPDLESWSGEHADFYTWLEDQSK